MTSWVKLAIEKDLGSTATTVKTLIVLSGMAPLVIPIECLKPLADVIAALLRFGLIDPLSSAMLSLLP